jgi:hypothetical protein
MLEWFATPNYSCLDAIPLLVKRLQRPLQPHWVGRVGPRSTLLSLRSSEASHICLASKLLYHSCDNEDAKQIMWVGRKNTERVKWANQCVGYAVAVCRVRPSMAAMFILLNQNLPYFWSLVSATVAVDPKSNANLRFESQMANIGFIQEVFGSAILYRDKLRLFSWPQLNKLSLFASWWTCVMEYIDFRGS